MIFILVWQSARKKWWYDFKLPTKEVTVYLTISLQALIMTNVTTNLHTHHRTLGIVGTMNRPILTLRLVGTTITHTHPSLILSITHPHITNHISHSDWYDITSQNIKQQNLLQDSRRCLFTVCQRRERWRDTHEEWPDTDQRSHWHHLSMKARHQTDSEPTVLRSVQQRRDLRRRSTALYCPPDSWLSHRQTHRHIDTQVDRQTHTHTEMSVLTQQNYLL